MNSINNTSNLLRASIMKLILISITALFSLSSFAALGGVIKSGSNFEYLTKVRVVGIEKTLSSNLKIALDKLKKENGISLFGGQKTAVVICLLSDDCYSILTLVSTNSSYDEVIRKTLTNQGIFVDFAFNNSAGNYWGVMLTTFFGNDNNFILGSCEMKLVSANSWTSAYNSYVEKMKSLLKLSPYNRFEWISLNFAHCGVDLTKAKRFLMVMDLAVKKECPLNHETNRTCFVARGFKKYEFLRNK